MADLDTCWWDLRAPCTGGHAVSVTFHDAGDVRRAGVRLSAPSLDANDIADMVAGVLGIASQADDGANVSALLIYNGISLPIGSPRLARVGHALLQRAGRIF